MHFISGFSVLLGRLKDPFDAFDLSWLFLSFVWRQYADVQIDDTRIDHHSLQRLVEGFPLLILQVVAVGEEVLAFDQVDLGLRHDSILVSQHSEEKLVQKALSSRASLVLYFRLHSLSRERLWCGELAALGPYRKIPFQTGNAVKLFAELSETCPREKFV